MYRHTVCGQTFEARASGGSKCMCGNRDFWRTVDEIFNGVDKGWTTDAVFQLLVGMDRMHFQHPLLGGTLPHFSERTGHIASHGISRADLADDLLPVPDHWEETVRAGVQARPSLNSTIDEVIEIYDRRGEFNFSKS